MASLKQSTDCLIIGAGISGLMAADYLAKHNIHPLILDKSAGVGGRMATRWIGDARFDHGAQEFVCGDDAFCAYLNEWFEAGIIRQWFNGELAHMVGTEGMTSVPKYLARNQTVINNCRVVSASYENDTWKVISEDGREFESRILILSSPVPQSLEIINGGDIELESDVHKALNDIRYNRCIAVMAVLDRPSKIGRTGWIRYSNGSIHWIADNQQKSISRKSSITIHSTSSYALEHWDDDPVDVGFDLLKLTTETVGAEPVDFQVHRWLYSDVTVNHPERFVFTSLPGPVWFCGDAFGEASCGVETAALSGLDAARHALELLNQKARLSAS